MSNIFNIISLSNVTETTLFLCYVQEQKLWNILDFSATPVHLTDCPVAAWDIQNTSLFREKYRLYNQTRDSHWLFDFNNQSVLNKVHKLHCGTVMSINTTFRTVWRQSACWNLNVSLFPESFLLKTLSELETGFYSSVVWTSARWLPSIQQNSTAQHELSLKPLKAQIMNSKIQHTCPTHTQSICEKLHVCVTFNNQSVKWE